MSIPLAQILDLVGKLFDSPGPDSLRAYIERNAIALLSNYNAQECPIDPNSATWLGRHAAHDTIRRAGLWNVNHVAETHSPALLDALASLVC